MSKTRNYKDDFIEFRKWNSDTEIEDLLQMDIGIMPLEDDQWAKGKCGFKALQYLSLGIPAVISPVGVNEKIIEKSAAGITADKQTLLTISVTFQAKLVD